MTVRWSKLAGSALIAAMASGGSAQLISTQTYQGRLEVSGAPAVGEHQIRFEVFDAPAGGTLLATQIRTRMFDGADNGLFTFDDLDFGDVFDTGADRWIQIGVRAGVAGAFTTLGPRQGVTSAPTAGVAGRLALPYADSTTGSTADLLHLSAWAPGANVHTAQFVHTGTIKSWASAAVVAQSHTTFGLIGSGGAGAGGATGVGLINGSFGVRADRLNGNPDGAALYVLDLADGNDVIMGNATHAGAFFGDVLLGAGVEIVGEEVDSTEVLDEPGVASASGPAIDVPTAGFAPIVTRSITAPGPGYVIAIASAEIEFSHTVGTTSLINYGVSSMSTGITGTPRFNSVPGTSASGLYSGCVGDQHVFPVMAGLRTFYFTARQTIGVGAVMYDPQITLIYVPTTYGAVTANEGGGPGVARPLPRPPDSPTEIAAEQQAELARHMTELDAKQREIETLMVEIEALRARLVPSGPQ